MKGRILVSLFACAAATSIVGFASSCDDTVIPNNVPTATFSKKGVDHTKYERHVAGVLVLKPDSPTFS